MELKLQNWILVEDIPLCLQHNIKMILIMYSVWHSYVFILLFLLLATSFGLNRASSGQYLQKLKNACAYSFSYFKYWPDDGLLRLKLVTNNRNNKIKA